MRSFFVSLGIVFLLALGCAPQKREISSAEQRRRIEDYRKSRQQQISKVGKWQEYKRTQVFKNFAPKEVAFVDTLKVAFDDGNSTRFYDAQGRITGGVFKAEGNLFYLGNGIAYTQMSVNRGEMKLVHGDVTSYLKLVDRFYIAPISAKVEKKSTTEIDELTSSFLQGKWSVYKKEVALNEPRILYGFEIGEAIEPHIYELSTSYAVDNIVKTQKGFFQLKGHLCIFDVGNGYDTYTILEATNDKLTLQQPNATYYLKNLSK